MRISSYRTGAALVNLATQANLIATEVADTALAAALAAPAAALTKSETGDGFSATALASQDGLGTRANPPAPMDVVTNGVGSVLVTWFRPEYNDDLTDVDTIGISGYTVYWGYTPGEQYEGGSFVGSDGTVAGTSLVINGLISGQTICVAVATRNPYGTGNVGFERSVQVL